MKKKCSISILSDCGLPTTTDNGTVVLSDAGITTYGASATHSCNVGYELNGVKTITCGDDGNWSKPAVTCTIKGYLYTKDILVSSCILERIINRTCFC